jgi:hypothetical protein
MKLRLRHSIAAAGCVAMVLAPAARAQEAVDQENLPDATIQYVNCGTGAGSISQGFTPVLPTLTAVEILMTTSAPAGSRTVRIRVGAVDGTIIGETTAPTQAGWTRYDFTGGVALIPGQLYVIELTHVASPDYIAWNVGDTYPGGNAYGCTNNVNLTRDVVFRTYASATPLPTRQATWGKVKTLYRE